MMMTSRRKIRAALRMKRKLLARTSSRHRARLDNKSVLINVLQTKRRGGIRNKKEYKNVKMQGRSDRRKLKKLHAKPIRQYRPSQKMMMMKALGSLKRTCTPILHMVTLKCSIWSKMIPYRKRKSSRSQLWVMTVMIVQRLLICLTTTRDKSSQSRRQ